MTSEVRLRAAGSGSAPWARFAGWNRRQATQRCCSPCLCCCLIAGLQGKATPSPPGIALQAGSAGAWPLGTSLGVTAPRGCRGSRAQAAPFIRSIVGRKKSPSPSTMPPGCALIKTKPLLPPRSPTAQFAWQQAALAPRRGGICAIQSTA